MSIEITLGWWLIPFAVTLISFVWLTRSDFWKDNDGGGDYSLAGIAPLIGILFWAMPNISMWFIWALLA